MIVGEDVEEVSRNIIKILNFRVVNQAEEVNPLKERHSSVYFSFDNIPKEQMLTTTDPTALTSKCSEKPSQDSNTKNSLSLRVNSKMDY